MGINCVHEGPGERNFLEILTGNRNSEVILK